MKNKKLKLTKKLYMWIIISIIIGLFFGLMVGEVSTTGKSVAVYSSKDSYLESDNPPITDYLCDCKNCGDSIYGTFVYGQQCKYSGKSTTTENVIDSCTSCCSEFNCVYSNYKLN